MSQWSERVSAHPVWQSLNEVGPAIDDAAAKDGNDEASVESLGRLKTVLAFVGKRLAGADPSLVHTTPLDGINTALQSMLSLVQAYVSDGSPTSLQNANAHADAALQHLSNVMVPFTPDDTGALKDAAVLYRQTMENQLSSVKRFGHQVTMTLEGVTTRLAELGAETAAERARTASALSEFQSQFSTAQDVRQTTFGSLVADYTQKLADLQATFTRDGTTAAKQSEDQLKLLAADYEAKARTILGDIIGRKLEVEKLVGVIGNLGVTSGHLKSANHARATTWVWQALTVLSFGGLIVFAYRAFLPAMSAGFTWIAFAARALLTVTVGLAAVYCASQADKYRIAERRSRQLALELEALGPFLTPLKDDEQAKFRLMVGERSFGRGDPENNPGDKSPASLLDMIGESKELREFLLALAKIGK